MGATLVFDIIRGLALLVGLTAGAKSKISDIVFTTWLGLGMFLFPDKVVDYQVSDKVSSDGLMYFLVRCFGASQLTMALFTWLTWKSHDTTVKGSILWAKTLGCVPLMIVMMYGQVSKGKQFGHGNLWFILPCFVAIWLYNIYQLCTPLAVGRREQKGPVSIVCKLYFLMIFVECLQAMAFPSTMLYFMNTSSQSQFMAQHFVRVCAASDFAFVFLAWYAPCFLRDEDKKLFFISQLAGAGLEVLSLLTACFVDHVIEVSQLYWSFLFMLPLLLPAVGLVLIIQKERAKTAEFAYSYNTRSKSE